MNQQPSVSVLDIYENEAKNYDKFGQESNVDQYFNLPSFQKYFKSLYTSNPRILELGCGTGRIIEYFIQNGVQIDHLAGLDISPEMLAIARKKLPNVEFIEGNASNITLPSNKYNLITSTMVFHHLDDKELKKTFDNAYTWLKKEGFLFYITSHPLNVIEGKVDKYETKGWLDRKTPWGSIMPHFNRTISDFINLTVNAGFQIKIVEETVKKESKRKTDKSFPSRLIVLAQK